MDVGKKINIKVHNLNYFIHCKSSLFKKLFMGSINFNKFFDECVTLLIYLAKLTHTTYKEINVIIFCIIEPIIFFVMLYVIIQQHKKLKKFRTMKDGNDDLSF